MRSQRDFPAASMRRSPAAETLRGRGIAWTRRFRGASGCLVPGDRDCL